KVRRIARQGAISWSRYLGPDVLVVSPSRHIHIIGALAAIAVAATLLALAAGHAADAYPSRPIVLAIPLPPGGTNDIMARAVGHKMSNALGQRSDRKSQCRRQRYGGNARSRASRPTAK